ncbi:uncharacterized protein [Asterias amurensis]|uniref:uncharacterized protein n=1 Tax=Asterias amurensis TaxID=7602 RepID=UPI003AB5F5CE
MSEIVSSVYGEAIESDSDEEEGSMGMIGERLPLGVPTSRPVPLRTLSAQPGVVVQGEASETDDSEDDEDDDEARIKRSSSDPAGIRHAGLPPLKVELSPRNDDSKSLSTGSTTSQNESQHSEKDISKFDTLLHRKLRERNASLQSTLHDCVAGAFLLSAKELGEANQMLAKSQSVIQDVSHNLRVFTTDLKKIEQRLDMINSCVNIPNIRIELKQREHVKN